MRHLFMHSQRVPRFIDFFADDANESRRLDVFSLHVTFGFRVTPGLESARLTNCAVQVAPNHRPPFCKGEFYSFPLFVDFGAVIFDDVANAFDLVLVVDVTTKETRETVRFLTQFAGDSDGAVLQVPRVVVTAHVVTGAVHVGENAPRTSAARGAARTVVERNRFRFYNRSHCTLR